MLRHIKAGVLEVAYEKSGPADGTPVVLLHGFPYDVHAYDEVVPLLAGAGCRTIVPYLRGYGPMRFLSASAGERGSSRTATSGENRGLTPICLISLRPADDGHHIRASVGRAETGRFSDRTGDRHEPRIDLTHRPSAGFGWSPSNVAP